MEWNTALEITIYIYTYFGLERVHVPPSTTDNWLGDSHLIVIVEVAVGLFTAMKTGFIGSICSQEAYP